MAKGSSFLLYFEGATTIDDAERALRATKMSITREGDELTVRWKGGPAFYLGVSDEPHVVLEAAEVAEGHELPELAKCARRFEVAFDDLDEVLDETNTLFELGATLQDRTRGYLVYAWNGNVIRPDGDPCPCPRCR